MTTRFFGISVSSTALSITGKMGFANKAGRVKCTTKLLECIDLQTGSLVMDVVKADLNILRKFKRNVLPPEGVIFGYE